MPTYTNGNLKIIEAIERRVPKGLEFKPSKEVYKATGLNPKRFGMILSGKISPTLAEMKSICDFFGIPLTEIIS